MAIRISVLYLLLQATSLWGQTFEAKGVFSDFKFKANRQFNVSFSKVKGLPPGQTLAAFLHDKSMSKVLLVGLFNLEKPKKVLRKRDNKTSDLMPSYDRFTVSLVKTGSTPKRPGKSLGVSRDLSAEQILARSHLCPSCQNHKPLLIRYWQRARELEVLAHDALDELEEKDKHQALKGALAYLTLKDDVLGDDLAKELTEFSKKLKNSLLAERLVLEGEKLRASKRERRVLKAQIERSLQKNDTSHRNLIDIHNKTHHFGDIIFDIKHIFFEILRMEVVRH